MYSHPLVTIIMPIRNEAGYIEDSLHSVLDQDYPPEKLQILVIDGHSTDSTKQIVNTSIEKYQNQNLCHFASIKLIENQKQIVPTALNIGLKLAQGEIIMRMDGHCKIPRNYLSHCVSVLQEEQVDCVGGPIETIGETPMAELIAIAMSSRFGVGDSAFRTLANHTLLVDTLAFGVYTQEAIARCGLFDEELVRNQDDEYNYRLRKLGGRILLSGAIRSYYYSRGTLRKLWSQYCQYGFWKVRVLQKHPSQMQLRQFAPPAFVAALIVGAFLGPMSPVIRQLWTLLVALYVLVNLMASLVTAAKRGWRHLLLLPVVFATLHISYGLGFLAGLIRFAYRWLDAPTPTTTPISQ